MKQAGAELSQAKEKLGLAKPVLSWSSIKQVRSTTRCVGSRMKPI